MNRNSKLEIKNLPLKVVFMGTPEIGATVLDELLKTGLKIEAVITRPDRPCGRGCKIEETPVKKLALVKKIPIHQPATKAELTGVIKKIKTDICVVAAYGMIIPDEALKIPKYGMINFHPSLLPLLRGPSPIPMAIMCGHQKTGVSIIQISSKMDAGDILAQKEFALTGKETTPSLSEKLAKIGAKMIADILPGVKEGNIKPVPQDEKLATFSPIIKKTDGEIFFKKYHAQNIEQAARAFVPWPGIYTTWNGKRLNLYDISLPAGSDPAQGRTLRAGAVGQWEEKIAIGTADGVVLVGALKIEGKNKQTAKEFLCGYRNFIGAELE